MSKVTGASQCSGGLEVEGGEGYKGVGGGRVIMGWVGEGYNGMDGGYEGVDGGGVIRGWIGE